MREARYGTWDKNDPKDAQVILYMMAQGMVQISTIRSSAVPTILQELANTYFQITLARMRLQHSLLLHYIAVCTFRNLVGIGSPPGLLGLSGFCYDFPRRRHQGYWTSKRLVVRHGTCSGRRSPRKRRSLNLRYGW